LSDYQANRIADAIKKAENSKSKPYGICSLLIKGNTQDERETYCRKICLNTIFNNYRRWTKSGKTNEFINFLGNRYSPLSDPLDAKHLNYNWQKNVKSKLDFVVK
jgi:hypothetical protein